MPCKETCPDDGKQNHEASPGPVLDDEMICRAAYGQKSHYNKSGVLRAAVIRHRDLIAGELSVWRYEPQPDATKEEILGILRSNAPPENALWDVIGNTAGVLRNVRATSRPEQRALHVVDDCRTGPESSHANHAVIGICHELEPAELATDDAIYVEIRDALFLELSKNNLYALPADERA